MAWPSGYLRGLHMPPFLGSGRGFLAPAAFVAFLLCVFPPISSSGFWIRWGCSLFEALTPTLLPGAADELTGGRTLPPWVVHQEMQPVGKMAPTWDQDMAT